MKILKYIGLIILVFCISCEKTKRQDPNVVIILLDDLGYGDFQSFNPNGKINTSNINNISNDGLILTNAHVTSSVCTPSRYSLLTGRYNWRSKLKNGVLTGISGPLIKKGRSTIADLFKKNDYQTGFIGKWHLGWKWGKIDNDIDFGTGWNKSDFENIDFSIPIENGPNSNGFDYSFGFSGSLDMAPYVYVENSYPTMIPTKTTVDTGEYTWWREGPTSDDFVHVETTPLLFEKSLNFIKSRDKEKPFFLYLALPSPHTPILPTKQWINKSELNPYADFVLQIDNLIGRLDSLLIDEQIDENTILIISSDNGCSPEANFKLLDEKGHDPSYIFRGHKADIFEGGTRVPLIIKWPKKIQKKSISNELVSLVDFYSTFAEILGLNLGENEGEDSFSLVPIFENSDSLSSRNSLVTSSVNGTFAIQKNEFKLITSPDSGGWSQPVPRNNNDNISADFQLYNLELDPGEENNLYSKNNIIANELKDELKKIIIEGRSTFGKKLKNENIDNWKQINWINK